MKAKSLSNTNPYLKRATQSGRLVKNIASSTAVETKEPVDSVVNRVIKLHSAKPLKLQKRLAS